MMIHVLRYELGLIRKKPLPLVVVFLFFIGLLFIAALVPMWGESASLPIRPSGVDHSVTKAYYESMLSTLGPNDGEKEALLLFFLQSGTDQYDYLPLSEVATAHDGAIAMSCAYSLSEAFSFLSVALGIGLGSLLFGFPFHEKRATLELSSQKNRSTLFGGKLLFGTLVIAVFCLVAFLICVLIGVQHLNQLFIFRYRDSFASASLLSLLFVKALAMAIGSFFFFAASIALGIWMPRPYIGPIVLAVCFALCFLFSNINAPSWGYYGTPYGMGYFTLFLIPFSNVYLGANFGFLVESFALLLVYLSIAMGLLGLCFSYLRRANL